MPDFAMQGFLKRDPAHSRALAQVRDMVCEAMRLSQEDTISVAEVACGLPGCPPLETVIVFWSEGRRHHIKVFKPVAQVGAQDLPPWWLKPMYAVDEDFVCECC